MNASNDDNVRERVVAHALCRLSELDFSATERVRESTETRSRKALDEIVQRQSSSALLIGTLGSPVKEVCHDSRFGLRDLNHAGGGGGTLPLKKMHFRDDGSGF